jgi:phosphoribosylformimino-5-aminoimidazole carboxamide ribotide isomerase
MIIIPVLDLYHGQVVRAFRGLRDRYQPIRSFLARSSDPVDVVAAFLDLFAFTAIYAADLDAIQGQGENRPIIKRLVEQFQSTTFWVDAGIFTTDVLLNEIGADNLQPVLGTEGLPDLSLLESIQVQGLNHPIVLSLDFLNDRFLGPGGLLERVDLWPERTIVMSLDHVGGAAGPDYKRIEAIRRLAPGRELFAAGGVRDLDDLKGLARLEISGALVASALHDGRIGPEALK